MFYKLDIETYFDHELHEVNIGIILSSIKCKQNIVKFAAFHSQIASIFVADETNDFEKNVYKRIHRDLVFVENFTLDIKECVFVFISVRHLDNSEIFRFPFDHKYEVLNIYCMILSSEDAVHAVDCSLYSTTGDKHQVLFILSLQQTHNKHI